MKPIFWALVLLFACNLAAAQKKQNFYSNGQLSFEGTVKDGSKEGPFIYYWPDGTKREEGVYEKDTKEGKWQRWSPDGQLAAVELYKDGNLNGPFTMWQQGGNQTFSKFRPDEPAEDRGIEIMKYEGFYKEGKMDSNYTIWYANGQKKSEGFYKNGSLLGDWTEWFDNGKKNYITHHNEQGPMGRTVHDWYPSGNPKSVQTYWAGPENPREEISHGTWHQWHENGELQSESNYNKGVIEGKWTGWYENGSKKYEALYKDNRLVPGSWKEWDEKGKAVSVGY